jgi:hypothetical protein
MRTRSYTHTRPALATIIAQSFALIVLSSVHAHAQSSGSATVQVNATVVQPLSVTAIRPLDFGTVFAGITKSVLSNDAKAAQVDVRGQGGAVVSVTLTMPTSLSLGSTGTSLPISGWTCVAGAGAPVSFTGGTPAPVTMAIPNTASPRLTIGIGATANPSSTQASGDYTGSGQVAVAYTDY